LAADERRETQISRKEDHFRGELDRSPEMISFFADLRSSAFSSAANSF